LQRFVYIATSKITACTSATGTASAKSAEAAATAVISSAATTAAAAEQVSEQEEDEAGVSRSDEKDKDEDDGAAADDDLPEAELDGLILLLTVVLMDAGEGDSGVGGDDLGYLADTEGDGGVVVALLGGWHHGAADVADFGVVEDAFEAVTYLDAASSGIHDENHEYAAVGPFGSNLPLVFKGGGELFYGLVAVEGFDGDDGDLGVGLTIDLSAEVFDALPGGGGENACEVVDVSGWGWEITDPFRVKNAGRSEKYEDQGQRLQDAFHRSSFYASTALRVCTQILVGQFPAR
jgi:hypothetical protein